MWIFTNIAMALDTLPAEGRMLLLALLLTVALYGFNRLLADADPTLRVLFGKGALTALVLVPAGVYLLGVQVPVPVEQMRRYDTPWPAYVVWALLSVWLLGAVAQLVRLAAEWRRSSRMVADLPAANPKISDRVGHWTRRLNLPITVAVRCDGAEVPWHVGAMPGRPAQVVLPAAARNWPVGVVDVMLLEQLAMLKQSAWRWMFAGRVIAALYWPTPWVARMAADLAQVLVLPGLGLAQAAYRDPEGFQRDLKQLRQRAETLQTVDGDVRGVLRLANDGSYALVEPRVVSEDTAAASFEGKWAGTKRRRAAKVRDPYEQAYWLIAVASIVVGVATTLTLKQAAPEFEPRFLNVKWQDQMVRRIGAYGEEPRNREPPRTLGGSSSAAQQSGSESLSNDRSPD